MWVPILEAAALPIVPDDPIAGFRRAMANREFARRKAMAGPTEADRVAAAGSTLARGAPATGWGSRIVGGISYV